MNKKTLFPPLKEQLDLIKRGTSEIIPEEELVQKLEKSIKEGRCILLREPITVN